MQEPNRLIFCGAEVIEMEKFENVARFILKLDDD
jgi:hypothetical protein